MGVLFRLWFFLSPVLYSITTVPARFRAIYELNPMCLILQCFRMVLLNHQIPGPLALGGALAAAVITATVGFVYFHIQEPRFARLN